MTLEQKVVAEIKEVLARNKCVIVLRERPDPCGRFGDTYLEARVLRENNQVGTDLSAVLHSE